MFKTKISKYPTISICELPNSKCFNMEFIKECQYLVNYFKSNMDIDDFDYRDEENEYLIKMIEKDEIFDSFLKINNIDFKDNNFEKLLLKANILIRIYCCKRFILNYTKDYHDEIINKFIELCSKINIYNELENIINTVSKSFDIKDKKLVKDSIIINIINLSFESLIKQSLNKYSLINILKQGIIYENKLIDVEEDIYYSIYKYTMIRGINNKYIYDKIHKIFPQLENINKINAIITKYRHFDGLINEDTYDYLYNNFKNHNYKGIIYHGGSTNLSIEDHIKKYKNNISFSKSKSIAMSFANKCINRNLSNKYIIKINTENGLDINSIINELEDTKFMHTFREFMYEEEILIKSLPNNYEIIDLEDMQINIDDEYNDFKYYEFSEENDFTTSFIFNINPLLNEFKKYNITALMIYNNALTTDCKNKGLYDNNLHDFCKKHDDKLIILDPTDPLFNKNTDNCKLYLENNYFIPLNSLEEFKIITSECGNSIYIYKNSAYRKLCEIKN